MDKPYPIGYNLPQTGFWCINPERIDTYPDICGLIGARTMSFACVYVADNGIIAVSDTRRTLVYSDYSHDYRDDEKKIFQIPDGDIFASITGGCRFGQNEEKTFADIICNISGSNIGYICADAIDAVREAGFNQDLAISFYRPIFTEKPIAIEYASVEMTCGKPIVVHADKTNIMRFFFQGEEWPRDYFFKGKSVCRMTVSEAVPLMSEWMEQAILSERRGQYHLQTVGGQCDMYVIKDGNVEHRKWTPKK